MQVIAGTHEGKKYMQFISKSYKELKEMEKTCKGKTFINLWDMEKWCLTDQENATCKI
jgi:hypothetical protein